MIHPANLLLNHSVKNNRYFDGLNAFVTTCYLKNTDFKQKNQSPLWHPACFIPYQYFFDFNLKRIEEKAKSKITMTDEIKQHLTEHSLLLQVLATWRYSGGIYKFDPDIYDYLINSETELILPNILTNLPEWSMFIETPGMTFQNNSITGFFAHFDDSGDRLYLKISLLTDNKDNLSNKDNLPSLLYLIIDLGFDSLDASILEITKTRLYAYQQVNSTLKKPLSNFELIQRAEDEKQILKKLLALLLYLCVKEPEIKHAKSEELPTKSKPSPKKGGLQFFPVNTKIWEVGTSTGEKIREYNKNKSLYKRQGVTMPHIRRAHFHLYWQGSRKMDNQVPVLKWLLPIPVGMNNLTLDKS